VVGAIHLYPMGLSEVEHNQCAVVDFLRSGNRRPLRGDLIGAGGNHPRRAEVLVVAQNLDPFTVGRLDVHLVDGVLKCPQHGTIRIGHRDQQSSHLPHETLRLAGLGITALVRGVPYSEVERGPLTTLCPDPVAATSMSFVWSLPLDFLGGFAQ
jgi:hypothetical protein